MYLKKPQILALIDRYLPDHATIIEAGAFDGKDTLANAARWSSSTIHAFEPVPAIYQLLTTNVAPLHSVHTHNVALSSATGKAQFHVSEKPSRPGKPFQAGSLHEPHERLAWSDARYIQTITVPTIRLEDWARTQRINRIDMLWLDAQGHELEILHGATQLLPTVSVIYTEVHFIQAYHGQPLYQELKLWVEARGFTQIAQDFQDQSRWFFGNVLFVRNDLLD